MQAFQTIVDALTAIPAWIPLLFYPAVLLFYTVAALLFGGRAFYTRIAIGLGGASFTLLACRGELHFAFVFLGLYALYAALLKFLFLIPPRKKREKRRASKDEKLYEKFFPQAIPRREDRPPKVCKFEEDAPRLTAEESGMQLGYAQELLDRLKKCALSPSDRLEVETISHLVEGYRSKPLTQGELGTLGDCLASALKMTAKYKL